ncbi:hypothetical protein F5B22DRAFT_308441 [Xylaria bambusicola]|uniref:uncharacterized protein n=1 Tax=Xylaria bambusicola TaxID=326684 RepID=UPI002007D6C3|nr:uncharacterized protein F5B22DRAFT_308441 [Xylaria bambusicola]KAI0509668.1 hypothetical protein F5B22DRAFT_308441 [Xylaria bambusicola]
MVGMVGVDGVDGSRIRRPIPWSTNQPMNQLMNAMSLVHQWYRRHGKYYLYSRSARANIQPRVGYLFLCLNQCSNQEPDLAVGTRWPSHCPVTVQSLPSQLPLLISPTLWLSIVLVLVALAGVRGTMLVIIPGDAERGKATRAWMMYIKYSAAVLLTSITDMPLVWVPRSLGRLVHPPFTSIFTHRAAIPAS